MTITHQYCHMGTSWFVSHKTVYLSKTRLQEGNDSTLTWVKLFVLVYKYERVDSSS